jgi:CRP-like cAMP-binding protein
MSQDTIRQAIEKSYFAEGLRAEAIETLVAIAALRDYTDGEEILSQHDAACDIMILVEGRAAIYSYTLTPTPNERISYVQVGQPFGEVALFDQGTRSAIVRSEGPSRVVAIDGASLLGLMDQDVMLASIIQRNIIRVLCARLRNTTRQLAMYMALDVV